MENEKKATFAEADAAGMFNSMYEMKKWADAYNKQTQTTGGAIGSSGTNQWYRPYQPWGGGCPSCGYCGHCGRGGHGGHFYSQPYFSSGYLQVTSSPDPCQG